MWNKRNRALKSQLPQGSATVCEAGAHGLKDGAVDGVFVQTTSE